jgi:membrane protease YdiL (CAAX protease family)
MHERNRLNKIIVFSLIFSIVTALSFGMSVVADNGDEEFDVPLGLFALSLVVILICLVIFFIIAILVSLWIYKDAEKRGKSGILWGLIMFIATLFFFPFGTIIVAVLWILARPPIQAPGVPPYGPPPQQPGYPPQQPGYPPQQPPQ